MKTDGGDFYFFDFDSNSMSAGTTIAAIVYITKFCMSINPDGLYVHLPSEIIGVDII